MQWIGNANKLVQVMDGWVDEWMDGYMQVCVYV
jgi:hypothetical protein